MRPLLFSLHSPSGSHQCLTQEGAAMPCWGARERLSSLLVLQKQQSASALHCRPVQRSALQPILPLSWTTSSGPGPGTHNPADQHRGAQSNHTFLLSVPAKRRWERKERGREQSAAVTGGSPNGVTLRGTPVFLILFAFSSLSPNNDDKIIDCHSGKSPPRHHCTHIAL